jgi:hypothetical protein
MKYKCPKCKYVGEHILKYKYEDGETPSLHLGCQNVRCGYNFNHWLCDEKTLKKIFGDAVKHYL